MAKSRLPPATTGRIWSCRRPASAWWSTATSASGSTGPISEKIPAYEIYRDGKKINGLPVATVGLQAGARSANTGPGQYAINTAALTPQVKVHVFVDGTRLEQDKNDPKKINVLEELTYGIHQYKLVPRDQLGPGPQSLTLSGTAKDLYPAGRSRSAGLRAGRGRVDPARGAKHRVLRHLPALQGQLDPAGAGEEIQVPKRPEDQVGSCPLEHGGPAGEGRLLQSLPLRLGPGGQ